jgi:hypothetical protein
VWNEGNTNNEACDECGAHDSLDIDIEGYLACTSCGIQIEKIDVFDEAPLFVDPEKQNSGSGSGRGDAIKPGSKLTGSSMGRGRDYSGKKLSAVWQKKYRWLEMLDNQNQRQLEGTVARRETIRMIKEICIDYKHISEVALEFFAIGWPEPRNRQSDFITTANAAHPFGRSATAAATILLAGEIVGIKLEMKNILEESFRKDEISMKEAHQFMVRAMKCLRKHMGPSIFKGINATSKMDAVLTSARDSDIRLGMIEAEVRKLCINWGNSSNPRIFDSPANYVACVAYEISKVRGLRLKISDIQEAFTVSMAFRAHSGEVIELLRRNKII